MPNIRRLLPVFLDKARDLSSYLERRINSDPNRVIKSACFIFLILRDDC
jgi:hypothetical protein